MKQRKFFVIFVGILLITISICYFYKVNTSFWGSADPVGTWWHRQAEKPDIVNFDVAFEYIPNTETASNSTPKTEKYTVTVNKKEQSIFVKQFESQKSNNAACLATVKDKDKLEIELTSTSGKIEIIEKNCDTDLFSEVFFVSKYSDIFILEEPLSSNGNNKHFSASRLIPGDTLSKLLCEMLDTENIEKHTAFIEAEIAGLNKYEGHVAVKNCSDTYQRLYECFTDTNGAYNNFEQNWTVNCDIYFY